MGAIEMWPFRQAFVRPGTDNPEARSSKGVEGRTAGSNGEGEGECGGEGGGEGRCCAMLRM